VVLPFFSPLSCFSGIAGPEETKNPAGESPPPDSDPFDDTQLWRKLRQLVKPIRCNPELQIRVREKRSAFHPHAPVSIAMRISNPDRSPLRIKG
jgi:hypothetical protein